MATMSMNKAIHGAVRRDLARLLAALDSFPDGDRARADALGTAWANFHWQLTHHHEGEHEIAWPALVQVGVDADLLAQMDGEHDRMAEALASTDRAMTDLRATPSTERARAAHAAVEHLRDVTVEHLEHEEAELEPVFTAKRDDPAVKEMGRKFGRSQPLPEVGQFFAWVMDGASPDELAAIRQGIPGPVLAVILAVFGRRYRREVAPVWR